jgi:hypothetical protein
MNPPDPKPWNKGQPEQNEEQQQNTVVDGAVDAGGAVVEGTAAAGEAVVEAAGGALEAVGGVLEGAGGCLEGLGGCSLAVFVALFVTAQAAFAVFR